MFSIRFLCFFSWSAKLTYNRLNTRRSLERSVATNCIYQKHSPWLFTLRALIKKLLLRAFQWLLKDIREEQTLSAATQTTWRRATFKLITFICLSLQLIYVGSCFSSWLGWWECDCSCFTAAFLKDNKAYTSCRSYLHRAFITAKFTQMQPLITDKMPYSFEGLALAEPFFSKGFMWLWCGFSNMNDFKTFSFTFALITSTNLWNVQNYHLVL